MDYKAIIEALRHARKGAPLNMADIDVMLAHFESADFTAVRVVEMPQLPERETASISVVQLPVDVEIQAPSVPKRRKKETQHHPV